MLPAVITMPRLLAHVSSRRAKEWRAASSENTPMSTLRYSSFLHPGRTQGEDEQEREHKRGTAECLKGIQTVV